MKTEKKPTSILIDFSHHAYLVEADKHGAKLVLSAVADRFFDGDVNSPDIRVIECDSLDIDAVRNIQSFSSLYPVKSEYLLCLISFNRTSIEAANALLKTIEEPAQHTVFILATPNTRSLPITIASRCQSVTLDIEQRQDHQLAKEFLKSTITTRLELIKKWLGASGDLEQKEFASSSFLDALEDLLGKTLPIEERSFAAHHILFVRSKIDKTYIPRRTLFEHLALCLPVLSSL